MRISTPTASTRSTTCSGPSPHLLAQRPHYRARRARTPRHLKLMELVAAWCTAELTVAMARAEIDDLRVVRARPGPRRRIERRGIPHRPRPNSDVAAVSHEDKRFVDAWSTIPVDVDAPVGVAAMTCVAQFPQRRRRSTRPTASGPDAGAQMSDHAWATLPLKGAERYIGVLTFSCASERRFDAQNAGCSNRLRRALRRHRSEAPSSTASTTPPSAFRRACFPPSSPRTSACAWPRPTAPPRPKPRGRCHHGVAAHRIQRRRQEFRRPPADLLAARPLRRSGPRGSLRHPVLRRDRPPPAPIGALRRWPRRAPRVDLFASLATLRDVSVGAPTPNEPTWLIDRMTGNRPVDDDIAACHRTHALTAGVGKVDTGNTPGENSAPQRRSQPDEHLSS